MEFKTTNMFQSDEETNQVSENSKCIVYTDLLLDDLCAIQWLAKMYDNVCILPCCLNSWSNSKYGTDDSFNDMCEKIKSWGDVEIVGPANNCIKEFEDSDLYLLAPLTEFVELVEDEEELEFLLNFPTVMMAGEELGEDGVGNEYNAVKDEYAYKFIIKNIKTLCQVTDKMCKKLFKDRGYPFESEYLEEYIEKIGEIEGEEVYCPDLQAVTYGYNALKSVSEDTPEEDDEIEIYGIVSEGKLVINKAGSGIAKKLTNHVHVNEYADKITEIVIYNYTGNLEGIYSLVELLPKLESVVIEEMISVSELHLMTWFSEKLVVNIGKCSASSVNDSFVGNLKLNLTLDKCLISEKLGDDIFDKFGIDILDGIESECRKIFTLGNTAYLEIDKKDYTRINSVTLINILFGTRVRSKGNMSITYKPTGMIAGPGGYYFEKDKAAVIGELEVKDKKYLFDINFF